MKKNKPPKKSKLPRKTKMVHKPENDPFADLLHSDQEGTITDIGVDSNKKDTVKGRHLLVPNKQGDGASLEHREESVSSPSQQTKTTRKP